MYPEKELQHIRKLAEETAGYARSDEMEARRKLWTQLNSFKFTRPAVYIRVIPFHEFTSEKEYVCTDPYLRGIEKSLLLNRYRMKLQDDFIIEPFVSVRAVFNGNAEGVYGVPADVDIFVPTSYGVSVQELDTKTSTASGKAHIAPLAEEEDFEKLHVADYSINEKKTAERFERASEVFNGILEVDVDRRGELCEMWHNEISNMLGRLRGPEQIIWDVYDRPEWFHKLLAFMRDSILKNMDQTEAAGGFSMLCHQNQSFPYAEELAPPATGVNGVKTSQLWGYSASQETETFGPDHFNEFMVEYQVPIMERYGLTAYGCCENLTQKIDVLRKVKNLRRIAVTPFSDVRKCAEQLGKDYVASYRPSPSTAVARKVDEDFVRKETRQAFEIFEANGCTFDITLKDVETVAGDPNALIKWSEIVREEIERKYG